MLPTKRDNDAAEVRLSFVRSLYLQRGTPFTGMIAHVITASAIFAKTGDAFYLYVGVALTLIWAVRMCGMMSFDRRDNGEFTLAETIRWERYYVAGSVVVAGTLGIMCAYALVVSHDAFAELAAISITLASLISVVGRNFGSRLNVDMMILAVCVPLTAGFLILRDPFMAVLAGLLFPLFMTTRSMANGVREFLFNTVMAERKAGQLAERFDIALNNMSHGLFMLDGDGRIEVLNNKAREIFRVQSNIDLRGRTLRLALRLAARNSILPPAELENITRRIENLASGRDRRLLIRFSDDTWLEFTSRLRGNHGVVLIFEDVTARIRQEEKILQMARFDSLTGLPNRNWFQDLATSRLAKLKKNRQVALAVFDLDDFKHVNDTKGHVAGDRLLQAVATNLKDVCGDQIICSRFGGDEFVLFFPDIADLTALGEWMDKIANALSGHYQIDGNRVFVTVSGGVAIMLAGGTVLEDLHIKADLALYDAKRRDKNRWSLFVESMDEKYSARQKLKSDLRDAIVNGTINIAYQPMFTPDGTRIAGAEALSRWRHPELGPISPAVYIPLAEEMGIVNDLTRCMIDKAVADCASWSEDLFVSVNLSAYDLATNDIVSVVDETLGRYNLSPRRLHLEITESALVDDANSVRRILETFRSRGITIAIDDFGTGYSSLSYLDILPLNKVKIDRAFVANITEDGRKLKLLRGIVNLSRELGLSVVVEGVETDEQLKVILDNDCADLIQGFIFGAPMPAASFVDLAGRMAGKRGTAVSKPVRKSASTARG